MLTTTSHVNGRVLNSHAKIVLHKHHMPQLVAYIRVLNKLLNCQE